MCTGIAGALLLKEHFSREQAFASRESPYRHYVIMTDGLV